MLDVNRFIRILPLSLQRRLVELIVERLLLTQPKNLVLIGDTWCNIIEFTEDLLAVAHKLNADGVVQRARKALLRRSPLHHRWRHLVILRLEIHMLAILCVKFHLDWGWLLFLLDLAFVRNMISILLRMGFFSLVLLPDVAIIVLVIKFLVHDDRCI